MDEQDLFHKLDRIAETLAPYDCAVADDRQASVVEALEGIRTELRTLREVLSTIASHTEGMR